MNTEDRPESQNFDPCDESEGLYRVRVAVKFRDYIEIPYEDGVEEYVQKCQIGPWDELAKEYPGISLKRLYTSVSPGRLLELLKQATEIDQTYHPPNFFTFFVIDVPPRLDPVQLAMAIAEWHTIEYAYVESPPAPAPVITESNENYVSPTLGGRGYRHLNPAPDGVNALFAWHPDPGNLNFSLPGADGAGVQFIDMEKGWKMDSQNRVNHADLLDAAGQPKITLISGVNRDELEHGTNTLGVVVATDNNIGVVGIAPNASARVISAWRTASTWNLADTIVDAASRLNFGDVFLIEAQVYKTYVNGQGQLPYMPIEWESANFDSIRLTTALGIVVIEAAGNGGVDLDTVEKPVGVKFLNRASPDFGDSGAIMVGAASSSSPHIRLPAASAPSCLIPGPDTNYGSRIDCYAWGECVPTTATNTLGYIDFFDGTSSASAIIAGVAIVVQGIAGQNPPRRRFSPYRLRTILSDPNNGTDSANGHVIDRIGVMPDLRKIIGNNRSQPLGSVLNIAPDIYIRDFVGDMGDPHTGSISASPDIIVRPTAVPNPQAAFGPTSGTANSNTLSHEVRSGQNNYIYVRVLNRGGTSASNVNAIVYWAPMATLVTPNLWTPIGSVTIPNVPSGNVLTVSNVIVWPAASVPAAGQYCFVGLIGNAQDPVPNRVDLLNFDNFYRFVRNNNNVTWRSFNVVSNAPHNPFPLDAVVLPFLAPGAPDKDRRFRLEVMALLPEKARVWLEGPQYLMADMLEHTLDLDVDKKLPVARLELNPHGLTRFQEIVFPANSRSKLRLLVQIPEEERELEYDVYIRQIYENEEVGRVTWRLSPPSRIEQPVRGARRRRK